MNGTAITNRLQNSFKITCTDHRIIEILELRPSNRLPVSYYYRRHHTFDVKTCFQQNRYVFDVIVTSFVFCISWNFARDISTVFEEIKHLRSRAPEKYFTRLLK